MEFFEFLEYLDNLPELIEWFELLRNSILSFFTELKFDTNLLITDFLSSIYSSVYDLLEINLSMLHEILFFIEFKFGLV